MLQGEHSAILSTYIKLPFVMKIFVLYIFDWPFYIGFTVYETQLFKFHFHIHYFFHVNPDQFCFVIKIVEMKYFVCNIHSLTNLPHVYCIYDIQMFFTVMNHFQCAKSGAKCGPWPPGLVSDI